MLDSGTYYFFTMPMCRSDLPEHFVIRKRLRDSCDGGGPPSSLISLICAANTVLEVEIHKGSFKSISYIKNKLRPVSIHIDLDFWGDKLKDRSDMLEMINGRS